MKKSYFLSYQDKKFEDIKVDEVEKAYKKIDYNWLKLHYKTCVGLAVFTCVIEIIMGFFLIDSDLVSTTKRIFIYKFIILPSLINFSIAALSILTMKSKRLSQKQKIYEISLSLVAMCFVLFTVHITFTATHYIFVIAIVMTTIYADYILTSIAASMSIVSIIISELFIVWDLDKVSIFESTHRLSDFIISLFFLTAFSVVCMVVIKFEREKNIANIQVEVEKKQLKQKLHIDELTGIFNRKALDSELNKVKENKDDVHHIFVIIDIDKFKEINDTWGHHVGDICLVEFSKVLKKYEDYFNAFRYGGDEFCLLFRNLSMEEVKLICDKIRYDISRLQFEHYENLKITASFGISDFTSPVNEFMNIFTQADKALYEAKKTRNSIFVFE